MPSTMALSLRWGIRLRRPERFPDSTKGNSAPKVVDQRSREGNGRNACRVQKKRLKNRQYKNENSDFLSDYFLLRGMRTLSPLPPFALWLRVTATQRKQPSRNLCLVC